MAPSACHLLQQLLFILPIFSVSLTAPCIEAAFEILPSANKNLQTSKKSSPVYSSQSDADDATTGTATTTAARAQGAPFSLPRFPLTYDGLLRRRRHAAPLRKALRDVQYPYDESPGHPDAPSRRRPLHIHGDFPPDASHEAVHGTRDTDRKCHDCTRRRVLRKQLHLHAVLPFRFPLPCKARHGMRRGYDCYHGRSEETEDVPSKMIGAVRVKVACNERAFRKKFRHGSYMKKCHEHRGSDTDFLFENSPDIQRAFDLNYQHLHVASDRAYQYPESSYNVRDDYHVHNIQRDPLFNKVHIPFRERVLGEYSFLPDGRRDQFPDVSSNDVNYSNIYNDLHTHALHKSYKLSKHPKGYKSHNHKSIGFRDVLFGPESLYSRLFHRHWSSNQRILRRSMHTKGHSPDIHDDHVRRDHIFAHLFHHILHSHRPRKQHAFRGVTRNALSSEHEMASTSSVSPSSTLPSSVSPSVSPSPSVAPSSALPSSAEPTSPEPV